MVIECEHGLECCMMRWSAIKCVDMLTCGTGYTLLSTVGEIVSVNSTSKIIKSDTRAGDLRVCIYINVSAVLTQPVFVKLPGNYNSTSNRVNIINDGIRRRLKVVRMKQRGMERPKHTVSTPDCMSEGESTDAVKLPEYTNTMAR
jgi:hypothetical protein